MKTHILKKILTGAGGTLLLLLAVLCIHIYLVTRPKAPDARTRIMARADFKQDITSQDADRISYWLYTQKGVDHVLCNADGNLVVFTFAPVQTNAGTIISRMNAALPYKAMRYVPDEEAMKKGCPVTANSTTCKILSIFKHS